MNLIFPFDSILSALALTDIFVLMAVAIVVSGGLMIWLADHVADRLDLARLGNVCLSARTEPLVIPAGVANHC